MWLFSLAAFRIFSFHHWFSVILILLGVTFFTFILLMIYWTSWIYGFIVFIKFLKIFITISSTNFSLPPHFLGASISCTFAAWSCPPVHWCWVHVFVFFLFFVILLSITMSSTPILSASIISILISYSVLFFYWGIVDVQYYRSFRYTT